MFFNTYATSITNIIVKRRIQRVIDNTTLFSASKIHKLFLIFIVHNMSNKYGFLLFKSGDFLNFQPFYKKLNEFE